MNEKVSAQIWCNAAGVERVYGLGTPTNIADMPLLGGERHTYVRNEDRDWVEYEQGRL